MKNLIEKEGKYYKECNVVMLPTEDKTSIGVYNDNRGLVHKSHIHLALDFITLRDYITPQHLYIISDDKIKEDDWFLRYNMPFGPFQSIGKVVAKDARKIIATTDKLLITNKLDPFSAKPVSLPQPSQSFIKKYCEVGSIDKVLVEYTLKGHPNIPSEHWNILIKTDSYNTITIKSVKDSWTREEVEKLCKSAWQTGYNVGYHDETEPSYLTKEDWIRKNL